MGELAKLLAHRRKIGKVLGEGTYRAAKEIKQMKALTVCHMPSSTRNRTWSSRNEKRIRSWCTLRDWIFVRKSRGDHTSQARAPAGEADST